jgi:carboxyl-terminal processing protease
MPRITRSFFGPCGLLLLVTAAGCAGKAANTTPGAPATGATVQPPSFEPSTGPAPKPESRSPYASSRPAVFDATWTALRDKHYDPKLGGVDWVAVRKRYEGMAIGAPDEPTFYRVMNDMLGELKQSHLFITGPGDESELGPQTTAQDEGASSQSPVNQNSVGDPGITVRVIGAGNGAATITFVRPNSSAAKAGLRAGTLVTHIGGRPLAALKSRRAMRPVEERFHLRRLATQALAGPVGSQVTVKTVDANGGVKDVLLRRDAPADQPIRVGNLGPLFPEVSSRQVGDIGIVAFNYFLLEPVLKKVAASIDQFRNRKVKGLIIDLRGNPGGVAAMAIPLVRQLVKERTPLGTLQHRDHQTVLVAEPSLDITPYLGPVVVLTDEGTASTSEIFAAGLQEAGRALVVGQVTLGQALPSVIESLPGGAVLQYVVADFKTPKGVALEGRGVIPDRLVLETPSALASGQDPVLEAALTIIRSKAKK